MHVKNEKTTSILTAVREPDKKVYMLPYQSLRTEKLGIKLSTPNKLLHLLKFWEVSIEVQQPRNLLGTKRK